MSFILEALRKSEHEREKRMLPGLVERPAAAGAPTRLPWLLGGLAVLLVINAVVLAVVLRRPAPTEPVVAAVTSNATVATVPAPAPVPVSVSVSVPATAAPTRPPAPVRPLDAEADAAGADPVLDLPPAAAPRRVPTAAEPARPLGAEPYAGVTVAGVPSINQLPATATAGLPKLNIDLHVFSTERGQRFVVINGQRLHEGDTLREGVRLEEITPDGAVLDRQGTRFLLPRE